MNSAVCVCWVAKMGKNLVAHRTGFERTTGLHILELQKDPAAGSSRQTGGLNQRSLNPWCFEGLGLDGRRDAPHDEIGGKKRRKIEEDRDAGEEARPVSEIKDNKPEIGNGVGSNEVLHGCRWDIKSQK